jgi:hypothetical protein
VGSRELAEHNGGGFVEETTPGHA